MLRKRGFTLVEILFVVIIAAGILAYAVPSYKRTKERARYEAATGVLMDLGSTALALKQKELGSVQAEVYIPSAQQCSTFEQSVGSDTLQEWSLKSRGHGQTSWFFEIMFCAGFMQPYPQTGYNFYLVNNNGNSFCANKCKSNSGQMVACMCQSSSSASDNGCFYGAIFYRDGRIERLKADGKCSND